MHEGSESRQGAGENHPAKDQEKSRPQQGGEGGTTRFGMEDGDNSDVPATGGPTADED